MRIITRYRRASLFIITIFFCGFFSLFGGLLFIAKSIESQQQLESYNYKNEAQFIIILEEFISPGKLLTLADGIEIGNIIVNGPIAYFHDIDAAFMPDIYLTQNEDIKVPTNTGVKCIGERQIIKPSKYVPDMAEIICKGEAFEVIGTVNPNLAHKNNCFHMRADDYFSIYTGNIQRKSLTIYVKSDAPDGEYAGMINRFKQNIAKSIPTATLMPMADINDAGMIYGMIESKEAIYSAMLYFFALVNAVIVSFYWISIRRREISIRKAFGATNRDIIMLISKDLFQLIGIAAILTLSIQTVVYFVSGGLMSPRQYFVVVAGYLSSLLVATGLILIFSLSLIGKISPAKAVKL